MSVGNSTTDRISLGQARRFWPSGPISRACCRSGSKTRLG
jgi:hypothetical protein